MNVRDIENFYNSYKQNLSSISRLEKKLLGESYSYEKWYDTLLVKSETLRDIYAHNLKEYSRIITYIIEHPDELSDEVNAEILTHVDFFLSEGYRDYGVTVPVIRAILPYWISKGNPGKIMDCYYFLGQALLSGRYYGEACNAFSKALECFDDIFDCSELYWTYRMMCAAYFRLLSYVGLKRINEESLLEYYSTAMNIWQDERISDRIISQKKKNSIGSILRNLICVAVSEMIDNGQLPGAKLAAIVKEEYAFEQMSGESDVRCCSGEAVYHKYLRASGRISVEEYRDFLTKEVNTERERFFAGFSYGTWDFVALFDDELTDEVFSSDKLFFMNPSFTYVNFALCELLGVTDSPAQARDICLSIYRYFMELPHISGESMVDVLLYRILSVMSAHMEDEEIMCDCILNLLVHRQIPTAIHVTMVAKLAEDIVDEMLRLHPEYFMGIFGLTTIGEIQDNAGRIKHLAYNSGICHDVGKLVCTDVINLQVRKILNEEFDAIKAHPSAGATLLNGSRALSDYSNVALCHHLFNDNSKGYPADVRIPDTPERIIIEVITVCDSIDAMSDNLGRNYAAAKSMETIMDELSEQAGTRYSARVVEFLKKNSELTDRVQTLLYEERARVNYDIYRRYVYPDTHFMPGDEKFIRALQYDELPEMAQLLDYDYETVLERFEKCPEYSLVMRDGYGNMYGNIFCIVKEECLYVTYIKVLDGCRRTGLGSMLLGYAERMAHEDGIGRVYLREVTQNHYDKFGWHNGYIHSEETPGWFEKNI